MVLLIPVCVVLGMSTTNSTVAKIGVLTVRALGGLLFGITALTWFYLAVNPTYPALLTALFLSFVCGVGLIAALVYDRLT